jgi:hypothetical protein
LVPIFLGCLAVFMMLLILAKGLPEYRAELERKEALQSCQTLILSRLYNLDPVLMAAPAELRNGELLTFTWTSAALKMRSESGNMVGRPAVCKFDLQTHQVVYLGFN